MDIPAGGLFTCGDGVKTVEQTAAYGGTAGVAYDECYHNACDTIDASGPERTLTDSHACWRLHPAGAGGLADAPSNLRDGIETPSSCASSLNRPRWPYLASGTAGVRVDDNWRAQPYNVGFPDFLLLAPPPRRWLLRWRVRIRHVRARRALR